MFVQQSRKRMWGLLAVVAATSAMLSGSAAADWKTFSANECILPVMPMAYGSQPPELDRRRNYIRVLGNRADFNVYCPVERDTTSVDKSLDELTVYAESDAGDCFLYGTNTSGTSITGIHRSLESDGSTKFPRMDLDGSTTAAIVLICRLDVGKKFYGYRYNEE